jgi:hypothetical protein
MAAGVTAARAAATSGVSRSGDVPREPAGPPQEARIAAHPNEAAKARRLGIDENVKAE